VGGKSNKGEFNAFGGESDRPGEKYAACRRIKGRGVFTGPVTGWGGVYSVRRRASLYPKQLDGCPGSSVLPTDKGQSGH